MQTILRSILLMAFGAAAALTMVGLWGYRNDLRAPQVNLGELRALETRFRALSDGWGGSVVAVKTRTELHFGRNRSYVREGSGTGFAFAPGGLILTNQHVIEEAGEILVVLREGGKTRELKATLVGSDQRSDLAVLKVDESLPPLKLRKSGEIHEGDWVAAMGNLMGRANEDGRPVFTTGTVAKVGVTLEDLGREEDRHYCEMLETSAYINLGSSGGPLVNLDGEVVGVNTAVQQTMREERGSSGPAMDSLGYAILFTDRTLRIIDQIKDGKQVSYGWLGVTLGEWVTQDGAVVGVLVRSVQPREPADEAGVKSGDVVTHFNGEAVQTPDQLIRLIGDCGPGEKAVIRLLRDGAPLTATAVLGDRSSRVRLTALPADSRWRGLVVGDGKDGRGAEVIDVEPGSPAESAGLANGDLVVRVGGQAIANAAQFREAANGLRGNVRLSLPNRRVVTVGSL